MVSVRTLLPLLVLGSLLAVHFSLLNSASAATTTAVTIATDATSGVSSIATHGGEKLIEDEFGKMIAVYVDFQGKLSVAYANSDPIAGGSWSASVKSPPPVTGAEYRRPAAVLVSPASLRIIVEGGTGPGHINEVEVIIGRDQTNNITGFLFGAPNTLDNSGNARFPAAVQAHNGDILAVWWQNETVSSTVKAFRRGASSGTWTSFDGASILPDNAIVDIFDREIIQPNLIQRRDNQHIYLVGNRGEDSPTGTLVFNKATFDGNNWSWGAQALQYETEVARGLFDTPSLAWDPARQLVVATYDISGTEEYAVFTLNASDVKTHIDTPSLPIANNEWGNIAVDGDSGDYFIFMIDSVDPAVNHDNGRVGYVRRSGGVWDTTFRVIDPDTNNVGISVRRAGTNPPIDILYSKRGAQYGIRFVRLDPANHPPVLQTIGSKSADEETALTFNATATDPDGDPLTFSLGADAPPGATITSSGTFSWTPNETQGPGNYPATIIVSDPKGATDSETVTITVREVNRPPVLSVPGPQTTDENATITFRIGAADPDIPSNTLTLSATGLPDGANFDQSTGEFSWIPREDQGPNDYTVTFTAIDNGSPSLSDTRTVLITVNEHNRPPVLDPIGNIGADEETLVSFTETAADADIPSQTLTFSLGLGFPDGAVITPDGSFSWTPSEAQGPGAFPITVIVSDGSLTSSVTFTVTVGEVNKAPVFSSVGEQTVNEGSTLTFTVQATDPDLPNNNIVLACPGCSLIGSAFDPATGLFTWTPSEAQGPGTFTVNFTSTDDGTPPLSNSLTFTIQVNEVNQAPQIEPIGDRTGDEEVALSFTVVATDPDLPENAVTLSISSLPTGATFDQATGTFSWTPNEGQGPGTYTITFTARDNGSPPMSSQQTITITVNEVNKQPSLTVPGDQAVDELALVSFTIDFADADIPSNELTLTVSGLPQGAAFDQATKRFSWTPSEEQGPGDYVLNFTVTDNGNPPQSNTKNVTVRVREVNQAPVLTVPPDQTVSELVPLTFTVSASDPDAPQNAITLQCLNCSEIGASFDSSTGLFSLTPSEAQGPGDYSARFTATDNGAPPLSDTKLVRIIVQEVNTPPSLTVPGSQTVDEARTLTFTVSFTDQDLPANTVTLACNGCDSIGAVFDPATGQFSFTPREDQGPGSFTVNFTATDNGSPALSDNRAVSVQVAEVNQPPQLGLIENRTVNEETALAFTAPATDADLPQQSLSFSLGTDAPAGAFISPTGEFSWTPGENQGPGMYTFTVVVSDGSLTDSQAVTISVLEVNKSPVMGPVGDRTVSEETLLGFTVTASDADLPAQNLSFSLEAAPNGAFPEGATVTAGGVLSWTPSEAQGPGTYSVTIRVSDSLDSDFENITITVTEVNKPPVLDPVGDRTVDEESLLSLQATASDPDGNPVTFSIQQEPPGASITPQGLFSWTPAEEQAPGVFLVRLIVSDGQASDFEDITITVNEVNKPPVLAPIGNRSTGEEEPVTFRASATDPDVPVQTLTFSLGPGAPTGAAISAGGDFSWTPTEAQGPGTYTVTIFASDGFLSDSETITITISEVNRPPTLTVPGIVIGVEHSSVAFTVSATDPDLPENAITFSATGLAVGASLNQFTGQFTWTPSEEQGPGSYTVTVTATDNGTPILSETRTVTITVNEVNQAPVLTVPGAQTVNETQTVTFTLTATDPDIPANSIILSCNDCATIGAIFDPLTRTFSWTPSEAQGPGPFTIGFTATDNGEPSLSDTKTVHITVNEVNQPPVIAPIGDRAVDEETLLTFQVQSSDPDVPPNGINISASGLPPGASFDTATGTFSWTPNESQGPNTYIVTITAVDNGSPPLTASQTVTILVRETNRPPVLALPENQVANEGETLTFAAAATDPDVPAQSLTYTLGPGAPEGASITPQGQFSWMPGETQGPGTFTVTIIVTDGSETVSDSTTITVNETNQPPTLSVPPSQAIDEGTALVFTATVTDPDLPHNAITLTASGLPLGATFDQATGQFSWTPSEGQGPGTYTVTITATDNGTPARSDTKTVTVEVFEVNQAPVIENIGDRTIEEESLVEFQVNVFDSDLPANAISLDSSGLPVGAAFSPSNGIFTWTPSEADGPGTFTITFTATDNGSPPKSTSQTVTITVVEVNKAPVLTAPGPQSVNEGQFLTFTVSATDPDSPPNTVTVTAVGLPEGATFNPATGGLDWTPVEAQGPGDYTVTFVAADDGTPSLSNTRTVTIHVAEVNSPPTLSTPTIPSFNEQQVVAFTVSATDPDLPANTLSLSARDLPTGASFDPSRGFFSWTPSEAQGPGEYTITFTAVDNGTPSLTDTKTVTVRVLEVNTPPAIFVPGAQTVDEGELLSFTVAFNDPDLPANTIVYSGSSFPEGASFDPATGVFTWIPAEAQGAGVYTVEFTVSDGQGASDSENVTVTVNEVNTPPVLTVATSYTVDEGSLLRFTVTVSDLDIPANSLTVTMTQLPAGAVFESATGEFSWTPQEEQGPADFTVTFTATDNGSPILFDTKSVVIHVNEANLSPILTVPNGQTVDELVPVTFTITCSDPDVPSNTLTLSASGLPSGATFNPITGQFTWEPSEAQGPGGFTLVFTCTDNETPSLSDTESVAITVSEVPVGPVLAPIGNQTVNEEEPLSFTAIATDPDVPANALSFSLGVGAPSSATIDPSRGVFSWTPSEAQGPGSFTVTITVSDGSFTDSETISIMVNEANRAPSLITPEPQTVNEGQALTFVVNATDPDIPQQSLTFFLGPDTPQGASITPDGRFSWVPSEDQGPANFALMVMVSDGTASSSQTFSVMVNEVNSAPSLAVPGPLIASEEDLLTFTVTASDPDLPANAVALSSSGLPPGATFNPVTGVFTWTPSESQGPGDYTVTFTATDNGLPTRSTSYTVTIHVNEVNLAPLLSVPGAQTVNELQLLAFTISATDPDMPANTVTLACTNCASIGATFNPANGQFSWTPTEEQGPATVTVIFTATDGGTPALSDSETVTINVREVNLPPVLAVPGSQNIDEETLLVLTLSASDPDIPGQNLVLTAVSLPPGASLDAVSGRFSWTPTETQGPGSYTATFRVTDGMLEDVRSVIIAVREVNRSPSLTVPSGRTVDEGSTLTFVVNATDPDVPPNNIALSASGLPTGASFDPVTGRFSWTPSEVQGPGQYTVSFTATDDGNPPLSNTLTVTVNVGEVNRPPSLETVGSRTVSEEASLSFTVRASDPDLPSNTLTFSCEGCGAIGATLAAGGGFAWTPAEAQGPGVFTVIIFVTDNGAPSQSDSETVTITVNEINEPPVLSVPGGQTVNEEATLGFAVTATDSDIPANTIITSVSGLPAGAAFDPARGVFTWTPSEEQGPGDYVLTFTATDNGQPALTDTRTLTIHVLEVNKAPVLAPIGNKSVDEETQLTFTVTASDADIPVQVRTLSTTPLPAGAVFDPATGTFTWTPAESQGPLTHSVTVTVSDGSAADSETFTITVREVNKPPVLSVNNNYNVLEGEPLAFTVTATDPDSPPNTLSLSASTLPTGASFSPATGQFSWTPKEAQGPGNYTITFTVTDNGSPALGESRPVTIQVTEGNHAPEIDPVTDKTVNEETLLDMTVTATDDDIPVQTLVFSLGPGAPPGSSITEGGHFTWAPVEAQGPGTYTITLIVSDGLNTDQEVFTVSVSEVNSAPVLQPIGAKTVPEEALLEFRATASDQDVPVQTLTFSKEPVPGENFPEGATITADGVLSWTPNEAQGPGLYSVRIVVTDGQNRDSEDVRITINEVDVNPTVNAGDNEAINELTTLTHPVTATDPDIVNGSPQTLTYSLSVSCQTQGATINVNTGSVSWITDEMDDGVWMCTVTVSDGAGPTGSDSFQVTVNEVNLPPVLTVESVQVANEESPLEFTLIVTDNDLPANRLTLQHLNLPEGATFDPATGRFRWTPSEAQAPADYEVRFTVTDNGSPRLSVTKTVTIQVLEINKAPVLVAVTSKTVTHGSTLTFLVPATDPDLPSENLEFSLGADAPEGARIDHSTGEFSWTPSITTRPQTYTFQIIVSDGDAESVEQVSISVNPSLQYQLANNARLLGSVLVSAIVSVAVALYLRGRRGKYSSPSASADAV